MMWHDVSYMVGYIRVIKDINTSPDETYRVTVISSFIIHILNSFPDLFAAQQKHIFSISLRYVILYERLKSFGNGTNSPRWNVLIKTNKSFRILWCYLKLYIAFN